MLKKIRKYNETHELLKFTQWLKDNNSNKEVKKMHKLTHRRLSKMQEGIFIEDIGDLANVESATQYLISVTHKNVLEDYNNHRCFLIKNKDLL